MPARRLLQRITVATVLAAGVAAAQDTPPAKDPPPPAGPQEPPAAGPPAPPAPTFVPPAILAQRRKGLKEPAANAAVAAGLDWLRRHRAEDGRWDCDGFDAACKDAKCTEPGMPVFDPGVTGLAVLAFLGSGTTHVEGADAPFLSKALQYLQDVQDSEGCFGPRTSQHMQYNHRVATMAVAEALWLTGDESLLSPAAKARDFILKSQNEYLGWRYGIGDGDNDTSSVSYAILALRTCEFGRLDVDRGAYLGAQAWFGKMSDSEGGRVGYQQRGGPDARAWVREPPRPGGPLTTDARSTTNLRSVGGAPDEVLARFPDRVRSALTAAAGASMTLVGGAESAAVVDPWASLVSLAPPDAARTGFLDLHYMLFGGLFQAQRPFTSRPTDPAGRKAWRPWRDAVVADLKEEQRKKADGCAAGSWDASRDPFGCAGGRVYATAMAVLALEAPNRFPRVWDPKAKPPKPAKPGPAPKSK